MQKREWCTWYCLHENQVDIQEYLPGFTYCCEPYSAGNDKPSAHALRGLLSPYHELQEFGDHLKKLRQLNLSMKLGQFENIQSAQDVLAAYTTFLKKIKNFSAFISSHIEWMEKEQNELKEADKLGAADKKDEICRIGRELSNANFNLYNWHIYWCRTDGFSL